MWLCSIVAGGWRSSGTAPSASASGPVTFGWLSLHPPKFPAATWAAVGAYLSHYEVTNNPKSFQSMVKKVAAQRQEAKGPIAGSSATRAGESQTKSSVRPYGTLCE